MSSVVNALETVVLRNEYAVLRNENAALHKECLFLKGMALLRFASAPEASCSVWNNTYCKSDPYTNYFYGIRDPHTEIDSIGLIVPDLPELRCEAEKLGVSSMVFFGYNTDPVEILKPEDIIRRLIREGGGDEGSGEGSGARAM